MNSRSNGNLPNRRDNSLQTETAPGTVTESQPVAGIVLHPAKRSARQAAGERPEPFRPCSRCPSQTMANASLPMPLDTGSTTAAAIAAPRAASTALPPCSSMRSPACAASGWLVATTLRASTGMRWEGYGKRQSIEFIGHAPRLGSSGFDNPRVWQKSVAPCNLGGTDHEQ